MAITVDIVANDDLAEVAEKASKALASVADREEKIAKLAEKIGVSHKEAAKAISMVEKETKQSEAATVKAARAAASAQKKAEREAANALKEKEKKQKEFVAGQKDSVNMAANVATAIVEVGKVVAKAVVFVWDMAKAFASAVVESGKARANASALMNAFTGGRGGKAMELVDKLATQLGVSIEESRQRFIDFRKVGISNAMGAQLIKLQADLEAVGLSADEAAEEIAKVTSAPEGARAAAIEEISKAYDGAGSGALAAKKNAESLDGAMARLENLKTEKLEELFTRLEPAMNKAATALEKFITFIFESDEGKKAVDDLVNGIVEGANAISTALGFVSENWGAFVEGFKIYSKIGEFMMNPILFVFDRIDKAFDGAITNALSAGVDLVKGFAKGIVDSFPDATKALKDGAASAMDAFKNILGIASPSKVFAGYGANVIEGFEQGQERALPSNGFPIEQAALVPPTTPLLSASPGAPVSSVGSSIVIESINVSSDGTPDDIAIAIRRELQTLISAMQLSRGFA